MWHQEELLKFIWHAFNALQTDHRGKVSISQLKVLSHNLCTVMKITQDPTALEEHFDDDNKDSLCTHGYMAYLNRFILSKVREDFDIQSFTKMCWTLCSKKNINNKHLMVTEDNAFKVWCIFNFLSEDKYPLVIIIEEVEFFLRKLVETMGSEWSQENFADYKRQLSPKIYLTVWELIELVKKDLFSLGHQTLSVGINEVFQELILDVLKQGYLMKKGSKRKNWTERWFILQPNSMSYYDNDDLVEKKGNIILDKNSCVESLADREGRKCLFIIKCTDRTLEISASDKKKKQEWIQAVELCLLHIRLGLQSPHREARQRRRELRQQKQAEEEILVETMKQLQAANAQKQLLLEEMEEKVKEAAAKAASEVDMRKKTQLDLQNRFRLDLNREKMLRQQMEEQVAKKSNELDQYLQRVRELEDMHHQLEEALEDERQARREEEAMLKLQTRLLEEETEKRAELEQFHLQQRALSQSNAVQKQVLVSEQKEKELQRTMEQLEMLQKERRGALEQYQNVSRKLERASQKTKTWKDKVAKHEGLLSLIQPGHKGNQRITNWGPASVTESELEMRKKSWQKRKTQERQ